MENNEEEKPEAGPVASPKGGRRKYSYGWLSFVFIFLFLLAGGYIAITAMRQSAHKLAGGANYNQLSANSAVYEGTASLSKDKNYFSSDETSPSSATSSSGGKNAADRLKLRGRAEGGDNPGASAVSGGDQDETVAGAEKNGPGFRPPPAQTSMMAKLQAKSSGFAPSGGQGSKTSNQGSAEAFQGGTAAGTTAVQKNMQGSAPKSGGGHGVLESLKGAFRASVYGARIASQDSAKSWIAKTFDATPEATNTIHYDDNVKASLDVVNPNSIPKFLRDIDVSAANANTLTASKVSNPALDKDNKKDDSSADSTRKTLAQNAASSMLGMFSFSPGTSDTTAPTDPTDKNAPGGDDLSASGADPDLVSVDEYGYVSYGDPNGDQVVFDSDGNLMGCTDNVAGISIPAGNPGCP